MSLQCAQTCRRNFLLSRIFVSSLNMKRSATSPAGEDNVKLKQMKLFEKKEVGMSNKKIEASWKFYGEPIKSLKPLMYMMPKDLPGSSKVASFDMDGCLIVPKSSKAFPVGPSDWKFLSAKVSKKLKVLYDDGFKIVIFTNQMGIEKKKTKYTDIQTKIKDIMNNLGFPIQAFASTGENIYRKPYTGSWDYFVQNCNGGVEVDKNVSFFVGDAAGRPKNWIQGRKKDHSCSDRKFAINAGLKFYTPEEYFDGAKPYSRFEWGSINPKSLLSTNTQSQTKEFEDISSKDTEMIVLVGYPASGKSTFAKDYLQSKGYVVVNRDTLKTQEKCEKTAAESLKSKKSVVVDNTNPSKEARASYVKIAKDNGASVRCFHFDSPIEVAKHMNYYRQGKTLGKTRRIPDVGYNVFKSRFVMPDKKEGFSEIRKIPFVSKFNTPEDKELFSKWT